MKIFKMLLVLNSLILLLVGCGDNINCNPSESREVLLFESPKGHIEVYFSWENTLDKDFFYDLYVNELKEFEDDLQRSYDYGIEGYDKPIHSINENNQLIFESPEGHIEVYFSWGSSMESFYFSELYWEDIENFKINIYKAYNKEFNPWVSDIKCDPYPKCSE